jgi:FdhD protein
MNDAVKNASPGSLATMRDYPLQRWDGARAVADTDRVAEEVPVAFVYNGLAHAVMMASPADLEDFALGFSLSEAIVARPEELLRTEVVPLDEGVLLRLQITPERCAPLEEQRRHLAGRTSCGLCGAESIEQAVRHPPRVGAGSFVTPGALRAAFAQLSRSQPLNAATGGVHAAAWATSQGELVAVREDVGRHNALDKLIGALVREGHRLDQGFALITSRASFEMAQKAATVGIGMLVAISAPTGLAIRLAEETGLTLVAFARDGKHNVYTNPERIAQGA